MLAKRSVGLIAALGLLIGAVAIIIMATTQFGDRKRNQSGV